MISIKECSYLYATEDGEIYSSKIRNYLSKRIDKYGYYVVTFKINKKTVSRYVHRLVAQAFVKNKDNKPQVNHKDSNKLNNSVTNLEWVTQLENNLHSIKAGVRPRAYFK